MTRNDPPALALALLRRVAAGNEPLVGDLIEEYTHRQAPAWFWTQVLTTMLLSVIRTSPVRSRAPLGILGASGVRFHSWSEPTRPDIALPPARINMSGIPVNGIGGLGLVAVVFVISFVMPAAWWLMVLGVTGGLVGGVVMVLNRRRHGLEGSGGNRPGSLFALAADPELKRGRLFHTAPGTSRHHLVAAVTR